MGGERALLESAGDRGGRVDIDDLEFEALRATMRHFAAANGLAYRPDSSGNDLRAVLASAGEGDDAFFLVAPRGDTYLSISLVLVVDEEFFRENVEAILAVTSRYEVCTTLSRDEALAEGEGYLNLSLRLFRPGLTVEVFRLALGNLRAARNALAQSFP